ncbi:MAG: hypothetical protein B6U69_03920, partial [Thermofilum sp. ex4484_15]
VRNEDRRFHVDPGANDALTPSYLLSKVKEYEPKLFYMAAGLTGLVDKVLDKVLAEVKNYGSITFLDLIEPRGDIRDKLRESLRYVDIIHCNYLEAKALTGEEGIEAILQELTKLGVRMITITLGGKGAYLRLGNLTIYQPSFKVEVIDPTGAGDAFCAGLIKKLYELNRLTSLPPQDRGVLSDILLYAQAVGAVKCTGIGASTAISESSVRRLIKMQGDRLRELEKFI